MSAIIYASGKEVLVDEADYAEVSQYRWYASGRYAYTQIKGRTTYMHRLIMQAPTGIEVDHINHDRLDNRRSNLRLVTRSQNQQNVPKARSDSKTGIRGVSLEKLGYRALLWLHGKRIHVGYFKTIEEAERAVKEARAQRMTHAPECEVAR